LPEDHGMKKEIIPIERIARAIFMFRDQRVMLDSDLAPLYGVPTGHLNRAVKRNASRFPPDFMFQLKSEELGADGAGHLPMSSPNKASPCFLAS
jgi:hypothetical protein